MKKNITAIFLSALLIICTTCPVYATTYTDDGTATTLVTAEIPSSFSIVLPATVSLTDPDEDSEYTGSYTIGARGNLNITKKIVCSPTADTFTMTGNGGGNVTASIEQNDYEWVNASPGQHQKRITDTESSGTYSGFSTISGDISATITDAGVYSGNMEFTFYLTDI